MKRVLINALCVERGPYELRNFVSHFIHIQIFQMEIHPCPSFQSHPYIPDKFVEAEIKQILIFLSNFAAKCKKKGTSVKYFTQETGAGIFAKKST